MVRIAAGFWGLGLAFAGACGAGLPEEFFAKNRVNRVILRSDGIAIVGPSTAREISKWGLGDDYAGDVLSSLAEASDANYYYYCYYSLSEGW